MTESLGLDRAARKVVPVLTATEILGARAAELPSSISRLGLSMSRHGF